jgi:hypothetical protein
VEAIAAAADQQPATNAKESTEPDTVVFINEEQHRLPQR